MRSILRTIFASVVVASACLPHAYAQQLPGGVGRDASASNAVQAALPAPSAPARDLFARYKSRLVQVRVLLNSANEQSSLGSGFVVRDDGPKGVWFITNYHVVASLAIDPEKYRIELRTTGERTAKATLVAVDVIHDLAVLRVDAIDGAAPWPAFALRDGVPTQGERLYSLGNPLEVGFLISEGIYNGPVAARVYEQMVFSGALNAGMSGGPAIDESGRVVGVNVAILRNAQLISFLVPVRFARELLVRAWQAPPRKEWRSEIGQQLLAHQDFVASKLLSPSNAASDTTGFTTQTLHGRRVPTLDGSLTKCWAGGRDGERLRFQRDALNCILRSELFVRSNLLTGSVSLKHTLLRNEQLATAQFLTLDWVGRLGYSFLHAGTAELTRSECRDEYLQGASHIYRVATCLKALRKFEGLYNITVSAVQMDDPRERMTSVLTMRGLSFDNGQRLTRMFLERLQ